MANPYIALRDAYTEKLKKQQEQAVQGLTSTYNQSVDEINRNNDASAKQAYIKYRQDERALPEDLAKVGVTGGASESGMLKLKSAYGAALEGIQNSRNSQLANAKSKYDLQMANSGLEFDKLLANAEQEFGEKAIAWQLAEDARLAEEAKAKVKAARAYAGGGGGSSYDDEYGGTYDEGNLKTIADASRIAANTAFLAASQASSSPAKKSEKKKKSTKTTTSRRPKSYRKV